MKTITIELTEQEALNLDDWLKQELEGKLLSATTRMVMENILKKITNEL